jgi:hypothetical protein
MGKIGQMVSHDRIHGRVVARRNLPNLVQHLLVDAESDVFHNEHSLCVTVCRVNQTPAD